jgi:nucleoside-diphosphate kinase
LAVVQRTLLIIKPDAVGKGLDKQILSDIHKAGLNVIVQKKISQLPLHTLEKLYEEHKGKPFYEGLIAYVTSGPVVKMLVSGPDAVVVCRKLMGATDPRDAAPGTIRGDWAGSL